MGMEKTRRNSPYAIGFRNEASEREGYLHRPDKTQRQHSPERYKYPDHGDANQQLGRAKCLYDHCFESCNKAKLSALIQI